MCFLFVLLSSVIFFRMHDEQKWRRTKIDEPPSKVQRLSTEINIEPDSDEESTDESDIDDDVFLGDL